MSHPRRPQQSAGRMSQTGAGADAWIQIPLQWAMPGLGADCGDGKIVVVPWLTACRKLLKALAGRLKAACIMGTKA